MQKTWIALCITAGLSVYGSCDRPWLFFDLGENTLVYTDGRFPAGDPHGDLVDMHYMPGAQEYLNDLVDKGYSVNLIINIPEGWGIKGLKAYVNRPANPESGDPGGWTKGAPLFNWDLFSNILVPLINENRKPEHPDLPFAPGELWLYKEAMKKVPNGCAALLQTGIKEEVLAAEASGMFAFAHPKSTDFSLMPESALQNFIKDHEKELHDTRLEQKKEEDEYAARGETIPRRSDPNSTE